MFVFVRLTLSAPYLSVRRTMPDHAASSWHDLADSCLCMFSLHVCPRQFPALVVTYEPPADQVGGTPSRGAFAPTFAAMSHQQIRLEERRRPVRHSNTGQRRPRIIQRRATCICMNRRCASIRTRRQRQATSHHKFLTCRQCFRQPCTPPCTAFSVCQAPRPGGWLHNSFAIAPSVLTLAAIASSSHVTSLARAQTALT